MRGASVFLVSFVLMQFSVKGFVNVHVPIHDLFFYQLQDFPASECNETDIRLVDGNTPDDGRVEICIGGLWGSVCDDRWDVRDATVVCRQLGYSGSSSPATHGGSSLFYHLDEVNCNGNETTLRDCVLNGVGQHDCSEQTEQAGVICSNNQEQNHIYSEGEVRLVDGWTHRDGRVEIYLNGFWGSVCDVSWDIRDATVVCFQLGYNGSSAALASHRVLSTSSLFYNLYEVNCNGTEQSLTECEHNGVGPQDCIDRYNTAGVICSSCSEGDARLVDGWNEREGWVEICLNGFWGSVCDANWDERDARVVCRQLGYNGLSIPLERHRFLSSSSLFYHFNEVHCSGNEEILTNCKSEEIGNHNCSEEAGVICYGSDSDHGCNETDIRLVDGETEREGRLEICINGVWGSVCNHGWDIKNARVVCRQLGYNGLPIPLQIDQVISTRLPISHINSIYCNGHEQQLYDCSFINSLYDTQSCEELVGVICNVTECNDTDVHLVEGKISAYSRVEICLDGFWGNICDSMWDSGDARVVCRQLGYDGFYNSHKIIYYHSSSQPHFYHLGEVGCYGNESHLYDCDKIRDNFYYCPYRQVDVEVICKNRECNEGDVRLVDGLTSDNGVVEVCLDGFWGSVCGDWWDYRDATVVCRQLGYDGPSYALKRENRFTLSANHVSYHCNGTENNITNCDHSEYLFYDCVGGTSAGAICANQSCIDGKVHLVGGDGVSRGRVEYCHKGTWYSVCADGWNTTGEEARAFCSAIGYSSSYSDSVLIDFGQGTSSILKWSTKCDIDSETDNCTTVEMYANQCKNVLGLDCQAACTSSSLSNCDQCSDADLPYNDHCTSKYYHCSCHSQCFSEGDCCSDVSVVQQKCYESVCQHGSVRLVGGLNDFAGRLEFCAHGRWGRVCNSLNFWGPDNAKVVCRQLGFPEEGGVYMLEYKEGYGIYENPAVIGGIHCAGTEPELLECIHDTIGMHHCSGTDDYFNTIISCTDEPTDCKNGDFRLRGGTDKSNGLVETCQDKQWIAVCNDNFDLKKAQYVCKQLFDAQDATVIDDDISEDDILNTEEICEAYVAVSCGKKSDERRCAKANGSTDPPVTLPEKAHRHIYGKCSVYQAYAEVCEGVLRQDVDFVYAKSSLGNQTVIAEFLNKKIRDIDSGDEDCIKMMYRVLCHYYLPPCGNTTHPAPPSSICQEECQMVQDKCKDTWNAALVVLYKLEIKPIIDCSDTSNILFPIPHCCTRAGLGMTVAEVNGSTTTTDIGRTDDINSIIVGTVVGLLMFIILTVVSVLGVALLKVVFLRKRRKEQLQRVQRDIFAMHDTTIQQSRSGKNSGGMELDNKEASMEVSACDNNTYSDPVSVKATKYFTGFPGLRTRVPSYRMRELVRGQFIVKSKAITLLDCIGQGEFGVVYKARLRSFNKNVAVKTLKGDFDQEQVVNFVEEIMKMSRFKHSHVMGLIGVCLDAGSAPYIIMPYMANGSLQKYLKKERNNVAVYQDTDEDEVKEVQKRLMVMCSQIASGMEYLAAEKYVHRDLAARNCMIDTHFLIKITDFGLSEDVFERNYFRQDSSSGEVVKLPIKWMAPESLNDGHFSEKSDVWSYGVTMWEIFSGGKAPYPGTDPLTLMQSLEQGHRMSPPYNTACTEEIYEMMMQCWKMSPEDRPTFKEICSSVSKFIECIAGYLEIGFNPFTAAECGVGEGEVIEEEKSVGGEEKENQCGEATSEF